MNEKLQLEVDDVVNIIYDDHEEWETVETEITGNWRHGNENTGVFRRLKDNKLFRIDWRDSTNDMTDFRDCNFGPIDATEVFPVKVTKVEYLASPPETALIDLENIKCSDGWAELCMDLGYGDGSDHSKCNEMFEYGEYGSITIEVDKNFNIVGGKIHKTGK